MTDYRTDRTLSQRIGTDAISRHYPWWTCPYCNLPRRQTYSNFTQICKPFHKAVQGLILPESVPTFLVNKGTLFLNWTPMRWTGWQSQFQPWYKEQQECSSSTMESCVIGLNVSWASMCHGPQSLLREDQWGDVTQQILPLQADRLVYNLLKWRVKDSLPMNRI